ncbi:Hypothetical protein D9617_13g099680 [Elsinoe fawcettii]|nr:Hypothetical protein D9617_13g099680 [Elsinoe fawcettii]
MGLRYKNQPTRTEVVASDFTLTTTPVATVTITPAWSLDLPRIFPKMPPSNLSVVQAIWDCDQEYEAWDRIKTVDGQMNATRITTITVGPSPSTTSTLSILGAYTTSMCPGEIRIAYSGETPLSTYVNVTVTNDATTFVSTEEAWITSKIGDKGPSPSCSRGISVNNYCALTYNSIYQDWKQSQSDAAMLGTQYALPFLIPRHCTKAVRGVGRWGCRVFAREASMLYWPPLSTTRDICGALPTGSLPYAYQNQSATVSTINGVEYTYPWVYITFHGITYTSQGSENRGIRRTVIDEVATSYLPDRVSSLCGVPGDVTTLPFDFRDLEGPVPWAAYYCQRGPCGPLEGTPCTTTVMDQYVTPYSPNLAYPQTLLDILHSINTFDADKCSFGWDDMGVPDPPRMFTTALSLTEPKSTNGGLTTMPGPVKSEAPMTSHLPDEPARPTITAGPQLPVDPSDRNPSAPADPPSRQPVNDPQGNNGNAQGASDTPGDQPRPDQPANQPGAADPPRLPQQTVSNQVVPGASQPSAPGADPAQAGQAQDPPKATGIADAIMSMINSPIFGSRPPPQGLSEDPGSQRQGDRPDPDQGGVAQPAAPLQAMITIGTTLLPVQHLQDNAHVVDGRTFWAGDNMVTAGRTLSFGLGGVVVDASSTVTYTRPQTTVAPERGSSSSGTGAKVEAVMVEGEMVIPGIVTTIAGQRMSYDGHGGLIVGTKSYAMPSAGNMPVSLEGGQVMTVARATLAPDSAMGKMIASVLAGSTASLGPGTRAASSSQASAAPSNSTTGTPPSRAGSALATSTAGSSGPTSSRPARAEGHRDAVGFVAACLGAFLISSMLLL